MAQLQYRVVPFIGKVTSGFFSKANAETVSGQLQTVIDHNVREGWEFYSVEKISIEVQPGCFGSLTGQKVTYINFDQIIFRRTA